MKVLIPILFFLMSFPIIAQYSIKKISPPTGTFNNLSTEETIEFERPANFFLSAGLGRRFNNSYSVTLSPLDYSVQFQEVSKWTTSISTGMVWSPFRPDKNKSGGINTLFYKDKPVQHLRNYFAVGLLIDVFQLSFSGDDLKTTIPFDIGLGLGIRRWDFMVLATIEFNYQKQPRDYFANEFKDQNKPLIFAGANEPTQVLDQTDNSIFYDKLFPTIGIKLAYAFTKKIEK